MPRLQRVCGTASNIHGQLFLTPEFEDPAVALLGFFTLVAVQRWRCQYEALPWTDNLSFVMIGKSLSAAHVPDQ